MPIVRLTWSREDKMEETEEMEVEVELERSILKLKSVDRKSCIRTEGAMSSKDVDYSAINDLCLISKKKTQKIQTIQTIQFLYLDPQDQNSSVTNP